MSSPTASQRRVEVERVSFGQYRATNARGGSLTLHATPEDFTAVELLLAAIGACTLADVDHLTSRRAEPISLAVEVTGDKVSDREAGNVMRNLEVTFRARVPGGAEGERARAVLPEAVARSHDRLCTVGRTVELASPIRARVADGPDA